MLMVLLTRLWLFNLLIFALACNSSEKENPQEIVLLFEPVAENTPNQNSTKSVITFGSCRKF